jgi:hypothetical protein
MARGEPNVRMGQMHAQKGDVYRNPSISLSPRLQAAAAHVLEVIRQAGGEATTSAIHQLTQARGLSASSGQIERILRAMEVSGRVLGHKGKGEIESRWTLRAGQEKEAPVEQDELSVSVVSATIGYVLKVKHVPSGRCSSIPLRPGYTEADKESAQGRATELLLRILGRAA